MQQDLPTPHTDMQAPVNEAKKIMLTMQRLYLFQFVSYTCNGRTDNRHRVTKAQGRICEGDSGANGLGANGP